MISGMKTLSWKFPWEAPMPTATSFASTCTATMVKSKATIPSQSFEDAVAELESIVNAMERDELPLEEALARYQRGVALLRQCQGTLNNAEQKIRLLENGEHGYQLSPLGLELVKRCLPLAQWAEDWATQLPPRPEK